MVLRDRNHPSIVIWGVRINESKSDPELYARTREAAKSLDPSRPTSGSMTPNPMKTYSTEWNEDVFAFDDYHAIPDGSVGIAEPVPGVPYMLAEAVGQFDYTARKSFDAKYRRTADVALQQAQAVRHAQAHDRAAALRRRDRLVRFRLWQPGQFLARPQDARHRGHLSRAQARRRSLPVAGRPARAAGHHPILFIGTPCRRGGTPPSSPTATALPSSSTVGRSLTRDRFPNLSCPPFFCDLDAARTELRIDGYLGERVALSRSFSSDHSRDRFVLAADDAELAGDGADTTRLVFEVVDRFGAPRAFAGGDVTFEISGPAGLWATTPSVWLTQAASAQSGSARSRRARAASSSWLHIPASAQKT
jgi:beta-galactosidase